MQWRILINSQCFNMWIYRHNTSPKYHMGTILFRVSQHSVIPIYLGEDLLPLSAGCNQRLIKYRPCGTWLICSISYSMVKTNG